MNKANAVDYRFKIIYAVAIILVVTGHCRGGGNPIDLTFSGWFPHYELHLALFMFSSGYFYKKESESQACKYIWEKTKRLIIPLYIYNFVYGVIAQLLKTKGFQLGQDLSVDTLFISPIINGHQFIYNIGGWFVIPLFMVQLYNIILRKLCGAHPEIIYFF